MLRQRMAAASLAVAATTLLAGAPAQAAASPADMSTQASCPASGYLCLYNNAGFLDFRLSAFGGTDLTGLYINNRTTSVRNRDSCAYRLYDNNSPTGSYMTIAANTEISNVGGTWNDRISYTQRYC